MLRKFVSDNTFFKDTVEARSFLDKYLFHFIELAQEANFNENNRPLYHYSETSKNSVFKINLLDLDPSYLKEIPVIEADSNSTSLQISEKIKSAFREDLVILRGFLEHFDLPYSKPNQISPNANNKEEEENKQVKEAKNKNKKAKVANKSDEDNNTNYFTMEYLKSKGKSIKIDIRDQLANYQGFSNNKHMPSNVPLVDYIDYIEIMEKKCKSELYQAPDRIKYGVNFDAIEVKEIYDALEKKIHPLLNFGSDYDALAYVRRHIHGVSTPQLYLKVRDAWTGGHEENLRLRSLNTSHGPGDSMWWGVAHKDAEYFHKFVLENYNGFNIYSKEGIWFAPTMFFMQAKINVYFSNQKPGDIVLVGPGCIHWVKALSHSVNSSWNFCTKELEMFQMAMDRYKINKQIKFRNIIPFYTLMLDLVNYEINTLPLNLLGFFYQELSDIINQEKNEYSEFISAVSSTKEKTKFSKISYEKEIDEVLVLNCDECNVELFNYWGFCQACTTRNKEIVLCLKCFLNHIRTSKRRCYELERNLFVFNKYDVKHLTLLLHNLELALKNSTNQNKIQKSTFGVIEELTKKTKIYNEFTLKKNIKKVFGDNNDFGLINENAQEDELKDLSTIKLFHEFNKNLFDVEVTNVFKCKDEEVKDLLDINYAIENVKSEKNNQYDDIRDHIIIPHFSPVRNKNEQIKPVSKNINTQVKHDTRIYENEDDKLLSEFSVTMPVFNTNITTKQEPKNMSRFNFNSNINTTNITNTNAGNKQLSNNNDFNSLFGLSNLKEKDFVNDKQQISNNIFVININNSNSNSKLKTNNNSLFTRFSNHQENELSGINKCLEKILLSDSADSNQIEKIVKQVEKYSSNKELLAEFKIIDLLERLTRSSNILKEDQSLIKNLSQKLIIKQ